MLKASLHKVVGVQDGGLTIALDTEANRLELQNSSIGLFA